MESEPGDPLAQYGASVTGELLGEGTRLGPFEVGVCLTVTLLGALYQVVDQTDRRRYLLQVLPSALTRDPRLKERLEKSVEVLAGVGHETVVAPLRVVEIGETLGIVYPDQSGEPLPAVRRSKPEHIPHSLTEVRGALKRVGQALRAVGEVGAHHFALSPDFLLVSQSEGLKVWGFGILESLDRRQFEIFISSAIVPLKQGTEHPDYTIIEALSPEWRNDDAVDVRADVFGLGVLAFSLLTGQRLPVESVPPSTLRKDLSVGWDYIARRLLDSEPQERYQTPDAVLTDLDRVERLGPTGYIAESYTGVLGRFLLPEALAARLPRRTRSLLQIGGVVVIVALFALAALFAVDALLPSVGTSRGGDFVLATGTDTKPDLLLTISPAKADVAITGDALARFSIEDGKLALVGPTGHFVLTVHAPGFRNERFEVDLGSSPVDRTIELEPAVGNLRLRSVPGSRVDVRASDGTLSFLGTVNEEGVLEVRDRLLAQEYNLVVSHPRYVPQELSEVPLADEEWTELQVSLVVRRAPLTVVSVPEGATVQVNGVEVGRTPLVIADVPIDRPIEVVVGGGALRTWSGRVQLGVEQDNILDVGSLEATSGALELNLTLGGEAPAPAAIDALTVALGDNVFEGAEALSIGFPAGRWALQVSHPGYFVERTEVTLRDGETTTLALNLRPKPATLEIALPTDLSVQVQVNGQRQRLDQGRLSIPAGQPVEVVLEAPDFQPVRERFELAANATEFWTPVWKPLPGPERGNAWSPPGLPMVFAWVRAGTFQMGSPLEEPMRRPNEGPVTTMHLTQGFWASATEVTQAAYVALMKSNPSRFRGANLPVDSVTWEEAREFCEQLTERERKTGRLPGGYVYRLPTEAEWEYFARAGSSRPFSFGARAEGGEAQMLGRYPRDFSQPDASEGPKGTIKVASFPPNAWGLHDVHGNVSEWTLDAYNDRLPGGEQEDYRRRGEGRGVPIRGGSWSDLADRCRSAARDNLMPELRRPFVGFRVVLAPHR